MYLKNGFSHKSSSYPEAWRFTSSAIFDSLKMRLIPNPTTLTAEKESISPAQEEYGGLSEPVTEHNFTATFVLT